MKQTLLAFTVMLHDLFIHEFLCSRAYMFISFAKPGKGKMPGKHSLWSLDVQLGPYYVRWEKVAELIQSFLLHLRGSHMWDYEYKEIYVHVETYVAMMAYVYKICNVLNLSVCFLYPFPNFLLFTYFPSFSISWLSMNSFRITHAISHSAN